jgi:hypothetical protein
MPGSVACHGVERAIAALTFAYAEDAPKIRPADETLRLLRAALCVAPKVGTGLGHRASLL